MTFFFHDPIPYSICPGNVSQSFSSWKIGNPRELAFFSGYTLTLTSIIGCGSAKRYPEKAQGPGTVLFPPWCGANQSSPGHWDLSLQPQSALAFQFHGTMMVSPSGSLPVLGTKTCKPMEPRVVGTAGKNSVHGLSVIIKGGTRCLSLDS